MLPFPTPLSLLVHMHSLPYHSSLLCSVWGVHSRLHFPGYHADLCDHLGFPSHFIRFHRSLSSPTLSAVSVSLGLVCSCTSCVSLGASYTAYAQILRFCEPIGSSSPVFPTRQTPHIMHAPKLGVKMPTTLHISLDQTKRSAKLFCKKKKAISQYVFHA